MFRKQYLSIIILLLAFAPLSLGQDNFPGLSIVIDQGLINEANAAINQLRNQLINNFRCRNQGSFRRYLQRQNDSDDVRGYNIGGYRDRDGDRRTNYKLYQQTTAVTMLLCRVKAYIKKYNNIIVGSANKVEGENNVVIGSYNNLTGQNSWIFASNYASQGYENGLLVIEKYKIELDKLFFILSKPRFAISCIGDPERQEHHNRWNRTDRKRRFRM